MKISLAPLIGPPTRWHNMLLTVEGRAGQNTNWGTEKEQLYGTILGEASQWAGLARMAMDMTDLEALARASGHRMLEACGGNEELVKAVEGRLYHDGHALPFWGWHLAQGRTIHHLSQAMAERAIAPGGSAFAHMLHAWNLVPAAMDAKGKIPWVGGRTGQSFLAPLTGGQHSLVLALGRGAMDCAKVFWDNLENRPQELLDRALLATLAHINGQGLSEGGVQWVGKLLDAGANPNARHPVSLGNSHHCVANGPAGSAIIPASIRQAVEDDGRWRTASDYCLASLGTWPKEEGSLTANDLVLANILTQTPWQRQWQELWNNYWKDHQPQMGLPWNSSPSETLMKILGDLHHRQVTMKDELAEDFSWVADHLLPTLSRQETWWESIPTVEQPWPAWETAIYTMNMKIPGTSLKAKPLGTFLFERLLGSLPAGVVLQPLHFKNVAEAIIENIDLFPQRISHFNDDKLSKITITVDTQHELLERSLDLVIGKTEKEGQGHLIEQKAKLIEELKRAGAEIVDGMSEEQKSGADTGNLRDVVQAWKRRLLLMTQAMAAPERGVGSSFKM